jgi:hypothetical protein
LPREDARTPAAPPEWKQLADFEETIEHSLGSSREWRTRELSHDTLCADVDEHGTVVDPDGMLRLVDSSQDEWTVNAVVISNVVFWRERGRVDSLERHCFPSVLRDGLSLSEQSANSANFTFVHRRRDPHEVR